MATRSSHRTEGLTQGESAAGWNETAARRYRHGMQWFVNSAWACVFPVAVDASAQTLPPANDFMGPPGTATMHANTLS